MSKKAASGGPHRKAANVNDVSAGDFIAAYAAHLKKVHLHNPSPSLIQNHSHPIQILFFNFFPPLRLALWFRLFALSEFHLF